ncbi:DNA-directed RNA polymerase III subunit RPC8 [Zostera marina]|uniref:DNA-directed RNA polymerase subunit n=1 Tax=Zostera marina TaxID=29655 RepID=A0A0K9NUF0_ZOSMR|nr:DNA-directed RNA polymerase III subunit RPC8 [Zostera marina]
MFTLSVIEHTLKIPPRLLNIPLTESVEEVLKYLYVDKVITDLGLCISVYDIHKIDGGFIIDNDGGCLYKVVFRLLMFRPFIGEIITAWTDESNEDGLRLTTGFFNDIYVPKDFLQKPSIFGADGIWNWNTENESYTMDLKEELKFRVKSIKYPSMPVNPSPDSKPFAPMEIIGAINEDGLGLVSWWDAS